MIEFTTAPAGKTAMPVCGGIAVLHCIGKYIPALY